MYLKRRCNRNDNCQNITNCLTLNICNRSSKPNIDIEINDLDIEETEKINLRRSARIAKIKDSL